MEFNTSQFYMGLKKIIWTFRRDQNAHDMKRKILVEKWSLTSFCAMCKLKSVC